VGITGTSALIMDVIGGSAFLLVVNPSKVPAKNAK
jgi:hypothetical protein